MRTVEIKLYEYSELSDKAKEKAREKSYERWCHHGFPADSVREIFNTELYEKGLGSLEPSWSLGYCQGDGVAFRGRVYFEKLNDDLLTELADRVALEKSDFLHCSATVSIHGRYTHENSMSVDIEHEDHDSDIATKVEKALLSYLAELSIEFRKMGYAELEYMRSDEFAQGYFVANEDWFLEDGTPYAY